MSVGLHIVYATSKNSTNSRRGLGSGFRASGDEVFPCPIYLAVEASIGVRVGVGGLVFLSVPGTKPL